jgi:hypothetical protein
MTEDTRLLIERVSALLEDSAADVEGTLTDGYARALALEAERVRLERRFSELSGAIADDRGQDRLPELRSVRQHLSRTEEELARLRSVLAVVRKRIRVARIAAAEG